MKPKEDLQNNSAQPQPDPAQRIELSPQTKHKAQMSTKNKTPAIATASEAGLHKMIKDAKVSDFGPLENETAYHSKTPNTGAPAKAKA